MGRTRAAIPVPTRGLTAVSLVPSPAVAVMVRYQRWRQRSPACLSAARLVT